MIRPQDPQLQRRAITPNPSKMSSGLSVSRRAVTPNPDWAMRCNSDDEEDLQMKKNVGHYRQPSYLNAFGADPRGQEINQRSSTPLYSHPMASYQPYTGTNNSGLTSRGGRDHYAGHGDAEEEAPVAIDLSGPIPKAAEYQGYPRYQGHPNMNGMHNHPYAGHEQSQHRVRTQSLGQELEENAPLKRTQSVENAADLGVEPPRSIQRSRTHSARPYDYTSGRPMVDAAAVSRPTLKDARSCGNLSQAVANDDTDNYGTYISRKTVQNILQHQGVKNNSAAKKPWPKEQFKDLRVDIPDNSSLNSNQESGYRSGSSGGDRNSASSTTSSLESPNDGMLRGKGDFHKPSTPQKKLSHIPEGVSSAFVTDRPAIPGKDAHIYVCCVGRIY